MYACMYMAQQLQAQLPGPTKVNAEHEFIITHYCEKSFDFFLLFSPFCERWKSFLSSVKGYTE